MFAHHRTLAVSFLGIAAAAAALVGVPCRAEEPPAARKQVVLAEPTSFAGHAAVMGLVELPPGTSEGRHTHPGELFGFVLAGSVSVEVEGLPKRTLKAGEAYHVLPGRVHDVLNAGDVTAKTAVVLLAESGKPPTSPAK